MTRLKLTTLGLGFALGLASLAPAHAEETVNFAWTPNPQTPQVDVALAKGYFKAAGLKVNLVSFPSGREGFEALLGNQVDFTFMAEFPAVTGALTKQPFGVVADLARYNGSRIIASSKDIKLSSAKDLNGLKIGTTIGTNVDYYVSEVLKGADVKATVMNASPVDLVPSLVRGDIQAAVLFPTFYEKARTTLGANYQELRAGGYSPHFIIAASQSALKSKPKMVEAFLGALAKADADVKKDPSAAEDAVLANLKGAMDKKALSAMWQDTDFGLQLKSDLLTLMVSEGKWILGKGVIKAATPTEASMRPYLVDAPLKAVSPASVSLP